MRKYYYVLVLLVSIFSSAAIFTSNAEEDQVKVALKEQPALDVAAGWLVLVDNDQYVSSWDEASDFFKHNVGKSRWAAEIAAARKALGKLMSRKLEFKKFSRKLTGAPDGEYYVLGYRSSFENDSEVFETVTVKKEARGVWRVAGYNIR